ncbi:MAG TPA: FGGY-family carbohydrate kinase [Bryobacteraceae bacterium]|nr:FGGY-family carbohydrate kinase [Bryobacteraceae bacterium]HXR14673.1 FGGY-family carbohydrate kinase [Terriglobales bacterium]HZW95691.1 FGGY-family carbohydrate kinase [Candidatus Eremiobacteraceae bacterium]
MSYVLGLDIGTTSTIGIAIRPEGEVAGLAKRPVDLYSERIGWAEENPQQWWSNVKEIIAELLASGIGPSEIQAIGVTGMLPAVILLDEVGCLLRPSIQQSDARCGSEVEDLEREVDAATFVARAGNGLNQQLVAPRLRWIEKHEPDVFRRIATVFGSYDYINWRLTGERAVEKNWALEGGFVDVASGVIADDLVGLAHIPRSALPRKSESHEILGRVSTKAAAETGLLGGTLVVGGAADLIASALGAGITRKGDVLLKFGGSVDILLATDQPLPDPRIYLDYHLVPGLYMPNGCMATGGTGLNWFVNTFAKGERAAAQTAGISVHQWLDRKAAEIPAGADGLTVLPYFLGEKTPIHDPFARALFSGLTLSHTIGHLWRAMLEGYAYALAHHIEVFHDVGYATTRYFASDGGSNSRVWMQIVADVLHAPIQLLRGHPGSCLGAAWTAAIGAGLTRDWCGISKFIEKDTFVEPNFANRELYANGYRVFRSLYRPGQPTAVTHDSNISQS